MKTFPICDIVKSVRHLQPDSSFDRRKGFIKREDHIMGKKQPNIVLIMTDQLRGDCLGIAGHPDVKTPYLDSLAAKGTLFDNAYSSCPSCIPARAALHTGLSQEKHGRFG